VKGNFHARFLGGVGGLTACTYPVAHRTMKIILVTFAIVAVIGGVLVLFLFLKFGSAVGKAHGQALYRVLAHGRGFRSLLTPKVRATTLLRRRASLHSSSVILRLGASLRHPALILQHWRRCRRRLTRPPTAISRVDRILWHISTRRLVVVLAAKCRSRPIITGRDGAGHRGRDPAHDSTPEEFKRFLGVFQSNQVPHHIVGDPQATHAFVPRKYAEAAGKCFCVSSRMG